MNRLALLFPGHGSQYIGMGKMFYENFTIAKRTFEEVNDVLGVDFTKICFEGTMSQLNKPENVQVALLISNVVSYRVYMQEFGFKPEFCAGHSLGEYSALTCAGAIKFSDAIKIVAARGKFTKEIIESDIGSMSIIEDIEENKLEEVCKLVSSQNDFVTISCYNSDNQYAISGHKKSVEKAENLLCEMGARCIPLMMSAPFHSEIMISMADKLMNELRLYEYSCPEIQVISNVTGKPYLKSEFISGNLTRQLCNPVKWQDTMKFLFNKGINMTIEMGSKNVLSNLIKRNSNDIKAFSFKNMQDIDSLKKYFV